MTICSYMSYKLGVTSNPALLGKILIGFGAVSSIVCAFAFFMAGKHYEAFMTGTKFSLREWRAQRNQKPTGSVLA